MMRLPAKLAKAGRRVPEIWITTRQRGTIGDDETHLRLGAAWLLAAQRAGGGGFAHSYHVLDGWQPAYPETTGYILPTLHRLHVLWGDATLREAMATAAHWLEKIQAEDGSFADLTGQPQVFDTGQILIGFNYLARHAAGVVSRQAHVAAARWLVEVQAADGSFAAHAYKGRPHAYYSRVGAALVDAGQILAQPDIEAAGRRNLDWTIGQQHANGFFRLASFDERPAFLHTIIYILEGLLDGHAATGQPNYFAAAGACAERLYDASRRDDLLRSQYADDFSVANAEYCMTGLAQWAGICLRLAAPGETRDWTRQANASLDFLKAHQMRSRRPHLNGGLMGSVPMWGRYLTGSIPNWGIKFFLDALLDRHGPRQFPPAG